MEAIIQLTQGYQTIVDICHFEYFNQWRWYSKISKERPYVACYASRRSAGKLIYLHREVLRIGGIDLSGKLADHVNNDSLDNRLANLRACDRKENARNRLKPSNNTSGFKGVRLIKINGKFTAQIRCNEHLFHLGCFFDPIDAAKAYDRAALKYFGEFACLNFPKAERQRAC